MNKLHLVSFADGAFLPRADTLAMQAKNFGLFDSVRIVRAVDLHCRFDSNHLDFMEQNQRGFGYWIWKPQVVKEALESASEKDVICYMDVGLTLNAEAKSRFEEYVQITLESRHKMLSFFNVHTEYKWTKADLAKRLSVQDSMEVMATSQLSSGLFFLCPTQSNRELIEEWANIAVESNCHFSDDSPSTTAEHPSFKEHRHDQSIFSLLRKIRGTASTLYEVQAYPNHFKSEKMSLPAWATRSRH